MAKIENKEKLLYSMEKAINETVEVMNSKQSDEREIYYRLGTALHWIADCFERIKEVEISVSDDDDSFWKALRTANNALKHKADLFQLHKQEISSMIPCPIPTPIERIFYTWKNIDNVKLRYDAKQKQYYKDVIEGKEIKDTFENAKAIINKYFIQCE